jgi:hypothetical protein
VDDGACPSVGAAMAWPDGGISSILSVSNPEVKITEGVKQYNHRQLP